jgi:hypothetical protein
MFLTGEEVMSVCLSEVVETTLDWIKRNNLFYALRGQSRQILP